MRVLKFLIVLGICGLFVGCRSVDREFGEELAKLTPVEPPTFVNAEVAEQFGKANFSARVEVHKGIPGTRPAIEGDLFGREGNLFFGSDEQRGGQAGMSGGLAALFLATNHTAYLLNDPLQAYAPMKVATNVGPREVRFVGEEMMNGERCRKSVIYGQALVGTNIIPVLIVWRSIGLQELPIRIESTNREPAMTLNMTRVKLQAPPAEMFELPNGFKAFESTDAMMTELVKRRTEAVDARARARREKYGDSKVDEESTVQQRQVRPY